MSASTAWLIICGAALGIAWGLCLIERAVNVVSDGKQPKFVKKGRG